MKTQNSFVVVAFGIMIGVITPGYSMICLDGASCAFHGPLDS